MELDIDEQNLIAAFRRLGEKSQQEVIRFASALYHDADASAADHVERESGSCKIARRKERPETAAEPICTE